MSDEKEKDIRERMTRHWLSAEPAVRAFVTAAIGALADREDVLQQVALTVARRFDEFDEDRSFVAWALWLAKSRIIDFYRSEARQRFVLGDDDLDLLAETLVQRQDEISSRRQALIHCLEKLPERSRKLIQLKYYEGQSTDQIAALIKSTPASVRVTLFRIRDALADCIRRRVAMEGPE